MIIKTANIRVNLNYKDLDYIIMVFDSECRKMGIEKPYDNRIAELKYLFEYIKADESPEDIPF